LRDSLSVRWGLGFVRHRERVRGVLRARVRVVYGKERFVIEKGILHRWNYGPM
jgi:hypothetical protein